MLLSPFSNNVGASLYYFLCSFQVMFSFYTFCRPEEPTYILMHSSSCEYKAQCCLKSGAYIQYVSIFKLCCNAVIAALVKHQPHFESPQFRHVIHPSILINALVEHLPHSCALAGKSDAPASASSACLV